jgi:hypothetical protein
MTKSTRIAIANISMLIAAVIWFEPGFIMVMIWLVITVIRWGWYLNYEEEQEIEKYKRENNRRVAKSEAIIKAMQEKDKINRYK